MPTSPRASSPIFCCTLVNRINNHPCHSRERRNPFCVSRWNININVFPRSRERRKKRTTALVTQPAQEFISAFVDRRFADETAFLAELVKVPSDNPPGDCAPHARRAQELLEGLGLEVEAYPVPEALVRANGMISATNLVVRQRFGDGTGPVIALNAH